MFAELLSQPGVDEIVELRGTFGFMAFHGGSLERVTDEIARDAAERSGASFYAVVQPRNFRWHLPSALVDPAQSEGLAAFVDHVEVVVAVHGFGRRNLQRSLLLGGQNRDLALHVGKHLREHLGGEYDVLDELSTIPKPLRGLHPDNPVNLPRGAGVQLELPPRARGLGPYWEQRGLVGRAPDTERLIAGLAAAASSWMAGRCPSPLRLRLPARRATGRAQRIASATMAYEYPSLQVEVADRVATCTIDHPPINLFDGDLMRQMAGFAREVADDDEVSVLVMQSANPDFFIAHADVGAILEFPRDDLEKPTKLRGFSGMVDRFRTMPKATIVKIEGCVRGGGSELCLSMDMRFAARGKAVFGQPEVALGILPGGSGTQRLPTLVGRGRALEVVLGCDDIDADTADAWGWINRALDPDEIGPFVDRLARRIASFPPHAVALCKEAVLAAQPDPVPGLLTETHLFNQTLTSDATIAAMEKFLADGGQTREVELELGKMWDPDRA